MKPQTLAGTTERRLLINYRIDPDVAASILPLPFKPSLVENHAIAGICLIQLSIRPTWLPKRASLRSFNGAHRFAVTLPDGRNAVYIPRRDTDSRLSTLAGGRLFPGAHHLADISVRDDRDRLSIELTSRDRSTHVAVAASTTDRLPDDSVFESVEHASDFFEQGSLGYSATSRPDRHQGLELRTADWSVAPVDVTQVESSFPDGSAVLDHALLMRDVPHTWHSRPKLIAKNGAC